MPKRIPQKRRQRGWNLPARSAVPMVYSVNILVAHESRHRFWHVFRIANATPSKLCPPATRPARPPLPPDGWVQCKPIRPCSSREYASSPSNSLSITESRSISVVVSAMGCPPKALEGPNEKISCCGQMGGIRGLGRRRVKRQGGIKEGGE